MIALEKGVDPRDEREGDVKERHYGSPAALLAAIRMNRTAVDLFRASTPFAGAMIA